MNGFKSIRVIGIGDDGCLGLSSRSYNATIDCQYLVGGERHLSFFPDHPAEKIVLKKNFKEVLSRISQLSHQYNIGILASGDPLFYGIASLIVKHIGTEHVDILPSTSSIQLAFSRIGKPWQDCRIFSVHGRSCEGIINKLQSTRKAAILTDSDNSPQALAIKLLQFRDSQWHIWVCENLGGIDERVRHFMTEELAKASDISPLNVIILERPNSWQATPVLPYAHEDEFSKRLPKKGLITKREIRVLALANLGLREDSVVWDIGAGSGSVAIEAAKICRNGLVFAVECDQVGIPHCEENILAHKTDNVRLIHGRAPECFHQLDDPNAIFIGGSKGSLKDIITIGFDRLSPGGYIVINAVTLENTIEAYAACKELGVTPEVSLLQISRGVPLAGRYLKYEALNPIHMFTILKQGKSL